MSNLGTDFELHGKLLAGLARVETSQKAQIEAFRAHEAYEERRFAAVERRVDKLEGVDASQATQALTDARAALAVQQSRGHGWAKAIVLLVVTTILSVAGTLAAAHLLGG